MAGVLVSIKGVRVAAATLVLCGKLVEWVSGEMGSEDEAGSAILFCSS